VKTEIIAVRAEATPELASKLFCALDADEQAMFFELVARHANTWRTDINPRHWQWFQVGRSLRNNEWATDDARAVVENIFEGMKENAG
jgi:hypothetical protein